MVEPAKQADTAAAAHAYEQYMVPSLFGPWIDDVLALATLKSGERVLDVACGTGAATRVAATRVRPGGSAAGLDIDPGMIEVARERSGSAEGPPIAWHVANALDMPFEDGAFDAVLCLQGVQFFPDRLAGFKEIRRVLTSSGRVAVSVWRTIDHCKGHAALAKVLERHGIDAQPARRPFSLGEADELAMLGHRAGFAGIKVDAVVKVMRFESPGDFVRILAAGAPSTRHALAKVSESQRQQIIAEVDAELQPYVDSSGLGLPYASHFLSAHA
jgi:SAM-dependent methyltransferase